MAQLTVSNVSLGYEGNTVVKDISFSISSGDYLCIVGENGAGKSTLLKALLNLHKPLSGSISFDGVRRNQLGYLPQQRDIQRDFPASAYEIVLSGCLNRCGLRPFYSKKEKELALESMKKLGAADLARQCFRELSGGQQQRVLLARALCSAQKMIFLDEPVAGLDPQATDDMYSLIDKINRDGITVIMVSHDISAAIRNSSHILKIDKTACFFGTKDSYFSGLKNGAGRKA